jgi:hypothetical protein
MGRFGGFISIPQSIFPNHHSHTVAAYVLSSSFTSSHFKPTGLFSVTICGLKLGKRFFGYL